ncbi:acetolactate decarboxylase [Listeria weihenstephanensis]|uniref:Alpha-acetolactate decarboxylase n=1 Tax=Listeria weihenstephanensis TaxID=1006155 RepID=A0A841Z2I4_9LIST|nr:acetolactate decarboxylase [Listeria weihenstephanensis]MBC1499524.1 acetolactate decarboxylase [Listeria weihenstephanensis]
MHEERKNRLFQHSTMAALVAGLYQGSTSFKELLTHGDFGIGTLTNLDGELIILDGSAYQIKEDGKVYHLKPKDTTPFASTTFFSADHSFDVTKLTAKAKLEAQMESYMQSPNLFYAIRITGNFRIVHTRVVRKQTRPYPLLIEAVKTQPTFDLEYRTGTIVGFWSPSYIQGLLVPGYHLHFMDDLKQVGGHVFDYTLLEGVVEIAHQTEFELELPHTTEFLNSDLNNPEITDQIDSIENKKD